MKKNNKEVKLRGMGLKEIWPTIRQNRGTQGGVVEVTGPGGEMAHWDFK